MFQSISPQLACIPSELRRISEKIFQQERLDFHDGLTLLHTPHKSYVQFLADEDRKRRVGNIVYYASTLHVYPTNLCELSCPMCSFYAKPGSNNAWFYTPQQIAAIVEDSLPEISEVHIVSGLWKDCDLTYYQELFSRIKDLEPTLHIKALTPVEYAYLAKIHELPVREVLEKLISWGLSSVPGGGAEILVEEIRKKIAPEKISTNEYLDIHRTAHLLGLRSNITMLYGHIEDPEHIIEHLCVIRDLQDETGGFHTFVPLKYQIENNTLGTRSERLKPKDDFQVYAVSRLMLDNISHIKVLWNYVGLSMAQQMLLWGANDMASITIGEKVATMAGGTNLTMTQTTMESVIRQMGRVPQKTHSAHTMHSTLTPRGAS
jgi:CofH subfamily radical SAM domain protein